MDKAILLIISGSTPKSKQKTENAAKKWKALANNCFEMENFAQDI